jgi:hypothetical protein
MRDHERRSRSSAAPELRLLRAVERQRRARRRLGQGARGLGAVSLLAVGAVHLEQYVTVYSAIPTIGLLFVLNFAGATAIALGLLAPIGRIFGRFAGAILAFLSLGGVGLAVTAFVFLLVSERTPLFGFMEPGYDPPAILASRVAESATVVFLGGFLVARCVRRLRLGRW